MRRADNTVVKHPNTRKNSYATEKAALAARTRMQLPTNQYSVMPHDLYVSRYAANIQKKTVRSLMTGQECVIPVDTPLCCNPSSETFWSM